VFVLLAASLALAKETPSKHDTPAALNKLNLTQIKAAVNKALPLIEKSSAVYLEERACFSCHHQAATLLLLPQAKRHGFVINEKNLQAQLDRTLKHLEKGRSRYVKKKGQGGGVDTAGYALWALEATSSKSTALTTAVVSYLLEKDKEKEHWMRAGSRPPSQGSAAMTSYLALRAMHDYGSKEQALQIKKRQSQVLTWMTNTKPKDTEDQVAQLRAFYYINKNTPNEDIAKAGTALLKQQQSDGGWRQTLNLKSDAYATGTALVALIESGTLKSTDPAYQKGLAFLLKNQLKDGSWHVKSRAKPFQTYFESGFPHGKDQFISMAASCWSTLALVLACPQ
jgi:hypothetical protein